MKHDKNLPKAARFPRKMHPGISRGTQLTMVSPFMGMELGTPLAVYSPYHPKDERLGRFAGYEPGDGGTVWMHTDETTAETRDWVGPRWNDVAKGRVKRHLNGRLECFSCTAWIICTR